MKGRARQLFRDYQTQAAASGKPFGVSRLILLARIVPERLTEDLDDPEVEERIEKAIESMSTGARLDTR